MEKFAFLLKTYQKDLPYALRLIKSFHLFNRDGIKMFVVLPKGSADEKLSSKVCDDVVIIDEKEACPYLIDEPVNGLPSGYINQEIIKLSFWENNLCENYFCLDSDGIFIRPFGYDDFLYEDGYPYTVLFEDGDLKADPDYYERFWILREEYLRKIKKEIDFNDNKIITCHGFQTFNHKALSHLKENFMKEKGYSYMDLMKIAPYEFSWYNFYIQKYDIIPIHMCGEIFKYFHTPKQYVFDHLKGIKIGDLQRSYVGIILNSNYTDGMDINYGDIFNFHVDIPWKGYIYIAREFFHSIYRSIKRNIKNIIVDYFMNKGAKMFHLGIKNYIYYRNIKKDLKRVAKRCVGGQIKPASTGSDMDQYYDWIKTWSGLKVKNIVEIGANYAQDAERLRYLFNLSKNDVYVFEAHPHICEKASMLFGFHTYNYAVFNKKTKLVLHAVNETDDNTGISTIMDNERLKDKFHASYTVDTIRMDDWMRKNAIDHIDFCKIDVEGATYEVLESFGNQLRSVNAIQLEAEHAEEYDGEKLWPAIKEYLSERGFSMVLFERHISQSDSFWIQNKYLKTHP